MYRALFCDLADKRAELRNETECENDANGSNNARNWWPSSGATYQQSKSAHIGLEGIRKEKGPRPLEGTHSARVATVNHHHSAVAASLARLEGSD